MPIILGTNGPVEQPLDYSHSPTGGDTTRREWVGTLTALQSKLGELRWNGWSYNVRGLGNGMYRVTADIAGDATGSGVDPQGNEQQDVWELTPNKVGKDILELDIALINVLDPENINEIRKFIQDPPVGDVSPAFTSNQPECLKVFNLMAAGVKNMSISAPVLRHTANIPPRAPSSVAYGNIGKVLTVATLQTSEGAPPDFIIPLSTFPSGAVTRGGIGMTHGWLKSLPTLRAQSNGSRQVTLEYEFGLWATDLYGAAI
jgi:hypothetical protein